MVKCSVKRYKHGKLLFSVFYHKSHLNKLNCFLIIALFGHGDEILEYYSDKYFTIACIGLLIQPLF